MSEIVWRKSSYSNGGTNCVEFAALGGGEVAVRNSREPDGTVLNFPRSAIKHLIEGAKDGEFDDLA